MNAMRIYRTIKMLVVVAAAASFTLHASEGFQPMGVAPRKENKDGNILVRYDRETNNTYFPGVVLSVQLGDKRDRPLPIKSCLEFVDAKYDERAEQLAVVFFDGLYLQYQRYTPNKAEWQLEQSIKLVEYNLSFTVYGNRLELSNLTTLRASFIRKGEQFRKGGRQRGVEKPEDRVYYIHVRENGVVMIDNQERKELRWHPDLGVKPQTKD